MKNILKPHWYFMRFLLTKEMRLLLAKLKARFWGFCELQWNFSLAQLRVAKLEHKLYSSLDLWLIIFRLKYLITWPSELCLSRVWFIVLKIFLSLSRVWFYWLLILGPRCLQWFGYLVNLSYIWGCKISFKL